MVERWLVVAVALEQERMACFEVAVEDWQADSVQTQVVVE